MPMPKLRRSFHVCGTPPAAMFPLQAMRSHGLRSLKNPPQQICSPLPERKPSGSAGTACPAHCRRSERSFPCPVPLPYLWQGPVPRCNCGADSVPAPAALPSVRYGSPRRIAAVPEHARLCKRFSPLPRTSLPRTSPAPAVSPVPAAPLRAAPILQAVP